MRNIIAFLFKYGYWFLFAIYVVASCAWIVAERRFQQSVFLTSANAVSSSVYELSSNVTGYFSLKSINEDLQKRCAVLENEVLNLRSQIDNYRMFMPEGSDSLRFSDSRYSFVLARVINNSTSKPCNFFTLNRGSLDGIKPGMGVVNQNGVVGIVNVTGPNTARVISLLNETQHFSVKVKGTHNFGLLHWKVGNPQIAYAEEMPRHMPYHIGDTVVTSGYSTTFPEGLPIGVVIGQVPGEDNNFLSLKLRLLPVFADLSTVRIIKDTFKNEIDSLSRFDTQEQNNN